VKRCPDPECPHRREHGRPAEYREDVTTCPDCGAHLVEEEAVVVPSAPQAPPVSAALWRRLAVTVLVPVAVLVLERVTLPGIDPYFIGDVVAWGGDAVQLSILSLGLVPIVAAYPLVEIAALIVPSWRWMRISGPFGRRRLERAVAIVAVVLALVQGYSVGMWLDNVLSMSTSMIYLGLAGRLLVMVTLAAGTMLLWVAARMISRHGLGNGFSVLLAGLTLPSVLHMLYELWMSYRVGMITPASFILSLGAAVAMVWLAWWMLRQRASSLRAPASGLSPVEGAVALLLLPATVGNLLGVTAEWLYPSSVVYVLMEVTLVAVGAIGFTLLYNRPSRVVAAWRPLVEDGSGLEPRARAWMHAAILPALVPLLLLVIAHAVVMRLSAATFQMSLLFMVVAVAVLMDVAAEWRARRARGELVAVWPVHRVYAVDPAVAYLARHGIVAFPRAVRHRTLLQFFGPFVPVELLVTEADAENAFELMRDAHGP